MKTTELEIGSRYNYQMNSETVLEVTYVGSYEGSGYTMYDFTYMNDGVEKSTTMFERAVESCVTPIKKTTTIYGLFEKYIVSDCTNLEDFACRYRKPDRYKLRDSYLPGYSDAVLESHREDLRKYGITWISRHESVTGKVVAFVNK
ncbi:MULTISPECIES: hypothetical protein [Dysgonomonas]|uniref:hypothetical protein n=1 Tax=Dysgonomonas TaxID=156973 RepID=UPI000927A13C|nr:MULTISPECIES: hypothetical protein [Dysgonomonas]MBN9301638.1 hypothetical protein [Dysgonomonas mossii]OJX64404.1 MAG: hypothetical protein BGO84_10115 [Dysgonomonas sp. 37-18]